MAKKGIKEGKLLTLDQIRLLPDILTRQSLMKLVEKHRWKAAEKEVAGLMNSMKIMGLINPVGVKKFKGMSKELLKEDGIDAVYYLVFGLRRYLAASFLGWEKIKAVILT